MCRAGHVYLSPRPYSDPIAGAAAMVTIGCSAVQAVYLTAVPPEQKGSVTWCAAAVTRHAEHTDNADWQGSDYITDKRTLPSSPLRERASDCKKRGSGCGTWL